MRTNNTACAIGNAKLLALMPLILPNFRVVRPIQDLAAVNPHQGIVSESLASASDVVVAAQTQRDVLSRVIDMAPVHTVFVIVDPTGNDVAARIVKAQNKCRWLVIAYQLWTRHKDQRRANRAAFGALPFIRSQEMFGKLEEWLPKLGAEIKVRWEPPQEEVA